MEAKRYIHHLGAIPYLQKLLHFLNYPPLIELAREKILGSAAAAAAGRVECDRNGQERLMKTAARKRFSKQHRGLPSERSPSGCGETFFTTLAACQSLSLAHSFLFLLSFRDGFSKKKGHLLIGVAQWKG
jgi:hypothetical protein